MRFPVLFLVFSCALLSVDATPFPPVNPVNLDRRAPEHVQLVRRVFNCPAEPDARATGPITWAQIAIARFCAFLEYKIYQKRAGANTAGAVTQPSTTGTTGTAGTAGPTAQSSTTKTTGTAGTAGSTAQSATTKTVGTAGAGGSAAKIMVVNGNDYLVNGGASKPNTAPSAQNVVVAPQNNASGGTIEFSVTAEDEKELQKEQADPYPYFEKKAPAPNALTCEIAKQKGFYCRDLDKIAPGSAWVSDYVIVGYINSGSFGSVYLANKGGEYYAIKMQKSFMTPPGLEPFTKEEFNIPKDMVEKGKIDGVVKMAELFEHLDIIAFSMEVATQGNLKDLLKKGPVPLVTAKPIMLKLATSLAAIHKFGVTIRDIKPDNILMFANNVPKYADFGLARRTDVVYNMHPGYVRYLSPEILKETRGEASKVITNYRPVDVFALGCTFYGMLQGQMNACNKQLYYSEATHIFEPSTQFEQLKQKDPVIAGIIEGMLAADVTKRLTAEQVAAKLNTWAPK